MFGNLFTRYSGLQKQVLHLYRDFVRVSRGKSQESRKEIMNIVRSEFKEKALIDGHDFTRIEHFLRKGKKQLEILSSKHMKGITVVNVGQGN